MATAQHAPARFRRRFAALIAASDVAKLASRLRNKLEVMHPGQVIGVAVTRDRWIVRLKSRHALRDKLRLFDTWYNRRIEYRVGGKTRSLVQPAPEPASPVNADAICKHVDTLQEIYEATQIHFDVLRRKKSAHLQDVIEGMSITLAKLKTVLESIESSAGGTQI